MMSEFSLQTVVLSLIRLNSSTKGEHHISSKDLYPYHCDIELGKMFPSVNKTRKMNMALHAFTQFKTQQTQSTYTYGNGCKIIKTSDSSITLEFNGEMNHFSEEGKQTFVNGKESVVEYSGLATDGRKDRSWAIARIGAQGSTPAHHHNDRAEVYYITSGEGVIYVGNEKHSVKAGDYLVIPPGKTHQAENASATKELELVVSCAPSWEFADVHFDASLNESIEKTAKSTP
jgi:mannose-6-phosphate isomerase-like protein (cupin superfamily)